jgi:hypothetical protein
LGALPGLADAKRVMKRNKKSMKQEFGEARILKKRRA